MKSWIVIIAGLAASWHYTDLASDSGLYSTLMPLLVFFFLVALLLKIVFSFAGQRASNSDSNSHSHADTGFFGGDDSGGCD
ncbi:MAG: hypothetical protein OIF55_09530 [Amphritea sp.]|nr:hypothetical protein [Amphritea sp.]